MNARRLHQFERQQKIWDLMKATGKQCDPRLLAEFGWGNSPLKNGECAARFQDKAENKLNIVQLYQEIAGGPPVDLPAVNTGRAVLFGYELATGRPVEMDADDFTTHGLVIGGSGAGKTTLAMRIACRLLEITNARIVINDHKGEGRRLLSLLGNRVILFRPDQEPVNWLEPTGQEDAYNWGFASELGRALNLRPETWTELPGILKRIHAGRKPDDPYRSLKDLERVLKHLAIVGGRHKLGTAASAIATFNHFLGRTAYIRKAPDIESRYRVIVYEHLGLPPRIHSLLTGLRLLRFQLKSTTEGIA